MNRGADLLHKCEVLVATRILLDDTGRFETEPSAKLWGLEIMGFEHNLPTSTFLSLFLNQLDEPRALA